MVFWLAGNFISFSEKIIWKPKKLFLFKPMLLVLLVLSLNRFCGGGGLGGAAWTFVVADFFRFKLFIFLHVLLLVLKAAFDCNNGNKRVFVYLCACIYVYVGE